MICPYCKSPQSPATGHCSTVGCGNADQAKTGDPWDSPEYQAFLVNMAKDCHADDRPCPGCCAGGICDGPIRGDDDAHDDDDQHDEDTDP